MAQQTKEELLETGLNIIIERGYNHTGIQTILAEAGVPKGSFYHYFASKEDFGLQVIDKFSQAQTAMAHRYLGDGSLSPLTRLRRYFEAYREQYESQQCRKGCLLGNLGQELADQNETFRTKIEQIFAAWRAGFGQYLAEAQQAGEISEALDVDLLAEFLLNSWEGAILRMRVRKDIGPIDSFIETVFGSVLKNK